MEETTSDVVIYVNDKDKEVDSVLIDNELQNFRIERSHGKVELPKTCIREYANMAKMSNELKKALSLAAAPRALAVLPWGGALVRPAAQCADITTYLLPANKIPEPATFFPIQWRYASGFTLVEIEPTLDNDKTISLTEEYLVRRDFSAILAELTASFRGENKPHEIPGFILSDTVNFLKPYASAQLSRDPLLNTYNPEFIKKCRLKLQPDDYLGFYKSDWSDVSAETKKLDGHKEAQTHYYAVFKYSLPAECVDQIKHVLYTNPNSDTWQKLINRKIFTRAIETARSVRHKFITDTLYAVGLKPRRSNPNFIDTEFDLFDTQSVTVSTSDGVEEEGICFYSGCASTARAERGMLVEISPERDAGLLWLHGASAPAVGGAAWKQPASINSLPVLATTKINKKTLEQFSSAGWNKANGYAKLVPINFV